MHSKYAPEKSAVELREEARLLALAKGLSVAGAYRALDRGMFAGTLWYSKMQTLRFLLGDGPLLE